LIRGIASRCAAALGSALALTAPLSIVRADVSTQDAPRRAVTDVPAELTLTDLLQASQGAAAAFAAQCGRDALGALPPSPCQGRCPWTPASSPPAGSRAN